MGLCIKSIEKPKLECPDCTSCPPYHIPLNKVGSPALVVSGWRLHELSLPANPKAKEDLAHTLRTRSASICFAGVLRAAFGLLGCFCVSCHARRIFAGTGPSHHGEPPPQAVRHACSSRMPRIYTKSEFLPHLDATLQVSYVFCICATYSRVISGPCGPGPPRSSCRRFPAGPHMWSRQTRPHPQKHTRRSSQSIWIRHIRQTPAAPRWRI